MDIGRIMRELGYRDVVPAVDAIRTTARWYAEHPLPRGGEIEQRLRDPFDYAAEDRLAAIYRESLVRMSEVRFGIDESRPHVYAHPREPGLNRDHRGR